MTAQDLKPLGVKFIGAPPNVYVLLRELRYTAPLGGRVTITAGANPALIMGRVICQGY